MADLVPIPFSLQSYGIDQTVTLNVPPLIDGKGPEEFPRNPKEVEALEKAAGYKIADKTNLTTTLSDDGKQYGMQYEKFIPILVKAVQELSAKNDALEARIKKLEDG